MKRYNNTDFNIILEEVNQSPTNLQDAFRRAAAKLDRSCKGVSEYYYRNLQKSSYAFLTVATDDKESDNYKVTREGKKATSYTPKKRKDTVKTIKKETTVVAPKKSKWKRILEILAE